MLLQDVSHAGIGDLMTQVGQGALNAVITPGRIFPGEPYYEVVNLLGKRRTPGLLLPTRAVIPLSSN